MALTRERHAAFVELDSVARPGGPRPGRRHRRPFDLDIPGRREGREHAIGLAPYPATATLTALDNIVFLICSQSA